jgi:hypothetical protein
MDDPDELSYTFKIHGQGYDSLSALHKFIETKYPEKFTVFQRKYGKSSSS